MRRVSKKQTRLRRAESLNPEELGRFRSRFVEGGPDECWEWSASRAKAGYGQLSLSSRPYLTHCIAWYLANGPIPERGVIMHTCDNPPCVNPRHLKLGTDHTNIEDSIKKGRFFVGRVYPKGVDHPRCLLTEDQVREIRARYSVENLPYSQMGAKYGVHRSMIFRIVKRLAWKHI